MKKITLLILALLTVSLLVACGGNAEKPSGDNPNPSASDVEETKEEVLSNEPIIPIKVEDYYKAVLFTLPDEPFRDAIVSHMRKQAAIEWVCGADFGVYEKFNSWGIDLTFKKGVKYTGIPYADTKVSYIQFEEALKNGKYTSESTAWKDVYGVQCVSSIMNSIQQFDPKTCGYSSDLTPGVSDFKGVIVGDYKLPEDVKQTQQIIMANSPDVMYEAYASLKKGDIVVMQDLINDKSHLRVVAEDPVIEKNNAGKINKSRSYITCVEQTNSFDATRKDGVKTTWYLDHKYTFDSLITTYYVPVTLEIYDKHISECEVPYITLDNEITPAQVAKGALGSNIKSNFPIRYVHLDILDKSGVLVKRTKVYDMAKAYSVGLRKHSYAVVDGLENGDYTFVVTAGIARDSAELARVDFTYSK